MLQGRLYSSRKASSSVLVIGEIKKLKKGVHLHPGMPAQALIKTGDRSVMGFLISPITETLEDAFREQ